MNNLLFLIAIPILLSLAPTATFALSANQTTTNETNSLLKAILDQQKLQIELQQDNVQVLAIKLDIIKAELERIQTLSTLSTPPTIQPGITLVPSPYSPNSSVPPILINPGCGLGTDNNLCNVPVPPSSSLNQTLNSTICREHNDNGVLITCPVFPSGLQPPIPLPPTPAPIPPISDCIDTAYGVFCPTN